MPSDERPAGEPESELEIESGPEDENLFGVLDEYTSALHRFDTTESGRLIARNPEHESLLRAIESLDRMAPFKSGVRGVDPNAATLSDSDRGEPEEFDAGAFDDPLPGMNVFGKFELLEELGRGGMGVVYRARQTDLGREVAIKMILSNRLASTDDVRRFKAEARTAAAIVHPGVVGIHEVGEHRGQSYFTMDYVSGPNLAGIVADGAVDPEEAARLVSRLAHAVQHLHDHGIVHRDLKPSNVLVDSKGEPRLTDFGLAKVFQGTSSETRTGTILGTASYMAPEQAAGQVDRISPRTDVYGLGAILYELLTGRPPFREEHALDTLVQVLEGEPERPTKLVPTIPRDLETICLKCLEKSPELRYESADEVAADLERYLRSEPIVAGTATLWQRTRRWARRQPALCSRLAGIVLAAGIIQVRYWILGGELAYHSKVMSIFAGWAFASYAFQWLADRPGWRTVAQYGWTASDVLLVTTALFIADGDAGPIVAAYPLVLTMAGLFFRVGLVAFTTTASIAGYTLYVVASRDYGMHPHYAIIFAVLLLVQGVIVAYHVHRVRVLSRYYGDRAVG